MNALEYHHCHQHRRKKDSVVASHLRIQGDNQSDTNGSRFTFFHGYFRLLLKIVIMSRSIFWLWLLRLHCVNRWQGSIQMKSSCIYGIKIIPYFITYSRHKYLVKQPNASQYLHNHHRLILLIITFESWSILWMQWFFLITGKDRWPWSNH